MQARDLNILRIGSTFNSTNVMLREAKHVAVELYEEEILRLKAEDDIVSQCGRWADRDGALSLYRQPGENLF
jgi:hypothetical protein